MRHPRLAFLFLLGALCSVCATPARAQFYIGAMGGLATLSGDASSIVSADGSSFSSYSPQNGPVLSGLAGYHISDYFSVQASYIWNRNQLTLSSGSFSGGIQNSYEETRSSSQQSVIGDVLVYFRKRSSRFRPYLSVGTGYVHLSSTQEQIQQVVGDPVLPAQTFTANLIALDVPVGIDVRLRKGWSFRYAFSETLTKNPISDQLSPPGHASLKNFQNLFGFVKQF